MSPAKSLLRDHTSNLVNQVIAIMIKDRPFDATRATTSINPWTSDTVCEVLRSIPRFFFLPTRSIGRQHDTLRHRAPIRQRNLYIESQKHLDGSLVLGPAAHRNPARVEFGLAKCTQFFYWVESEFGFSHNEMTVKEMAVVIAKSNKLSDLWEFLKEMSRRNGGNEIVTTIFITVY